VSGGLFFFVVFGGGGGGGGGGLILKMSLSFGLQTLNKKNQGNEKGWTS